MIARRLKMLRQLAPDIVHVTGLGWNDDLVLAAGLLRIPVILHVHLPEGAALRNLNRYVAAKVLFCSAFTERNFLHRKRIRGKSHLLYNVIQSDVFERAQPDRARFGLREHDVVVTMVSQIQHAKGLDVLLDAAARVLAVRSDVVFVHAGRDARGEPGYGDAIRARVQADPLLRAHVRFLGSRTDIPELMASSDVFVLPSRAEAFGLVVCEAMAAGKPVVVSDVGGIPEAVGLPPHGKLVHGFEPRDYADAILEVLSLPDMGREMGRLAQASVRARFHPDVIGTKLNAIYDSLLK
jgi:glycosyltransferase involved in cell wall biosynthesis